MQKFLSLMSKFGFNNQEQQEESDPDQEPEPEPKERVSSDALDDHNDTTRTAEEILSEDDGDDRKYHIDLVYI